MHVKECPNCGGTFSAKDKRKVYCGQDCYLTRDKEPPAPLAAKLPVPPPIFKTDQRLDLPDPDQLPAPYAKRVYDMWRVLIGESTSPVRIA